MHADGPRRGEPLGLQLRPCTAGRGRGRTTLIAGGAVALWGRRLAGYFVRNHYFPSTNDAYVHAYTVTVSPYVEGYIKSIHTEPNAFVKKGQLLYEIVPLPFQLSVAQQQHQLRRRLPRKRAWKINCSRLAKP